MTVTIRTDETSGIQSGNDETLNALPTVLIASLFGSAPVPVSVAKAATPLTYTGLTNLAFTDAAGAVFDGDATTLTSVSGATVFLYTLSTFDNVVVGRAGTLNTSTGLYEANASGSIIFAVYADTGATTVNQSDAGKTSADIWLVQYEALFHNDGSNPNDVATLTDLLRLSATSTSQFDAKGAPSGQNLFLMFGDTSPVAGEVALVVTGQAVGSTVNTSQGGGRTTIGVNNQMVDPGEGLYFSFVKLSTAGLNYTVPNLDQNEADVAANILFDSFYGVKSAYFSVVQTQPNKAATLTITAVNNTDNTERGATFIAGQGDNDDTAVNINDVQIYRVGSSTPVVFKETGGLTQTISGITVNFTGDTAVIIGAKSGDRIQYASDTEHNRLLIQNTGTGKAVPNASFDIGDFQIGGTTQRTDVVNLEFTDDGPIVTAAHAGGAVDEDGLESGIATNNLLSGDLGGEELTASGSVTSLFSVGADQPGSYSIELTDAALDVLAGLKSGGVALSYEVLNDTLTAKAGTSTVFTFKLESNGDFLFTLASQLDHASGEGLDVENDLTIDLSALVRASDKDGDTVVAATGALVITVDDDGPALSGTPETGVVDEDALTGGNEGGIGDVTAPASHSGVLTTVFLSGADQPLVFGLSPVITGLQNLTSGGVAVSYAVADNVLTASAGTTPVFTFAITNTSTGAYTFTLLKPLDHPAGLDENDINIDLSTIVQATDYDGDTVSAGTGLLVVSITADDDTPVVTAAQVDKSVDEDGLPSGIADNNVLSGDLPGADLTASGSVTSLFSVGADQPGSYGIDLSSTALAALELQGLSSGGDALTYEAVGNTLTAKADGVTVFTFTLTSAGEFTFTLAAQLDHASSTIVENDLTIDLSAIVRVTDQDNDSVVASTGALVITVDDDGPALSGTPEFGVVDEDALIAGNAGGTGDVVATASDSGDLTAVFRSGADQPLTYGLSPVTTGLQNFTSGGVAVSYAVVGNTLTASAGTTPVFTFAITNTSTGAYTFTLLKPLDHPAGDNENDINIDLSTIVQATDYDGDTVSAGTGLLVVSITADDDTPVVTGEQVPVSVDEDGLPSGIADNNVLSGDLDGESLTAIGSVTSLFSVGADQPGTYSIDLSDAARAALTDQLLESGGTALSYDIVGGALVAKAGAATVFTFALTSAGDFLFTLAGQLDHASGEGLDVENDLTIDLSALVRASDKDGDTVVASAGALVITVDDDGPAILAATDATVDNTSGTTPSGSGTFSYNLGADQRTNYTQASSPPTITDFAPITMGGKVGTADIVSPLVTLTSEDAASAVFGVSFQYAADPSQPGTLTTALGTLSFDKVADTYTFQLNAPLEGYTSVRTGGAGATFQGYQLDSDLLDGSQPAVSVASLSADFFVQFTGYQEPGGGTNGNNLKAGTTFADADDSFEPGELFLQANSWVSVSGNANGVAGDTMQSGEVLDMDFFNTNPKGQTTLPATQEAAGIFLRFDGIGNSEDLVVVLKLKDEAGSATTRAVIVDNTDIYKFGDALPTAYNLGTPLDNNDGVVFIESNDYNVLDGDAYVITGAQILGSTEGLTGDGISLNGNTGADGGSSATLRAFGADTSETTSEPIKISDIGFVIANSANLDADLYFDVAVIDYDGDATMAQRLNVAIDSSPPALAAVELMTQEPELLV